LVRRRTNGVSQVLDAHPFGFADWSVLSVICSFVISPLSSPANQSCSVLALLGGVVYGALVLALFGRRWLSLMRKRAQSAPAASIDTFEGVSPPPAGPDEQ
jgi:hypothetical protein